MTRILLIENNDDSAEPERIRQFLDRTGRAYRVVRPYRGEAVPRSAEGLDAAVIYGGGQEVYQTDRYPYLADEHAFAVDAVVRGVPLLGLCLGAQCIAYAHGAEVAPHPEGVVEFGYHPVTPTEAGRVVLPREMMMPQWHGHGFAIPKGAVRLAGSVQYPNQAFRLGSAWGFQFHPEVTPERMRRWQVHPDAPWTAPGAQPLAEQQALMTEHDPAIAAWFEAFLTRFFP